MIFRIMITYSIVPVNSAGSGIDLVKLKKNLIEKGEGDER
jgi:hypothetical protein